MARKVMISFMVALLLGVQSVFAIAGLGLQYGLDFSLNMDDMVDEQVAFSTCTLGLAGIPGDLPDFFSGITNPTVTGDMVPVFVTRTGWERTALNIGGKLFIDIIPFIDAIEISFNLGAWQYEGSIKFPDNMSYKTVDYTSLDAVPEPDSLFQVEYSTMYLTLDSLGVDPVLGLHLTPYIKSQIDLTIRKSIFSFPPVVNILKIYGGGGPTMHLATPLISTGLIEEAIGAELEGTKTVMELQGILGDPTVMEKVTSKIVEKALTPHWGMHLMAGVSVKPPILPLGIYADGKLMIPFGSLDDNVDLSGTGLLLNFGVMFAF